MLGLNFTLDPVEDPHIAVADPSLERRLIRLLHSTLELETDMLDLHMPFAGLALDSLDWVDLLSAVEEEFNVDIGFDRARDLACVGDLVRLIQESRHG
jgi:acyl carrier protein